MRWFFLISFLFFCIVLWTIFQKDDVLIFVVRSRKKTYIHVFENPHMLLSLALNFKISTIKKKKSNPHWALQRNTFFFFFFLIYPGHLCLKPHYCTQIKTASSVYPSIFCNCASCQNLWLILLLLLVIFFSFIITNPCAERLLIFQAKSNIIY